MVINMKRILFRIALIAAVAALALAPRVSFARPAQAQAAAEFLDRGEKYLGETNYAQAAVKFMRAIEVEPKNPRAYLGAAEAFVGLGDPARAIEILTSGLDELPGDPEIQAMLAAVEEAAPAPEPEPEPVPTPEPLPTPEPTVATAQEPEPEPAREPESEAAQTPEPAPEPTPEPMLGPTAMLEPPPEPTPESPPMPVPTPEPLSEPAPEPTPEPPLYSEPTVAESPPATPAPTPKSAPASEDAAAPQYDSFSGALTYSGEEVSYAYTAGISGKFRFDLLSDFRVHMYLYNENMKELANSRWTTDGGFNADLESGKNYVLKIYHADDFPNINEYGVTVGIPSAIVDVTGKPAFSGSIGFIGEEDEYAFTVGAGGKFRFELVSDFRVHVYLYNKNMKELANWRWATDGGFDAELEGGKDYVIKIYQADGFPIINEYTVTVSAQG
jgi:tetratricopeptide (TPR) repeat protein